MKRLSKLKLSLPRFTFKDTPINAYLVFTLVIFSFLLGMMTNKVMYLEKMASNPVPTTAVDPNQPPAPPAVVKNLETGTLPVLGNENAKVTIIEFSDFQCPFCKAYFDDSHKKIDEAYIKTGKVKFAYRHYPLTGIHPLAQKAAEAAECANEQEKFWEYHDILFTEQEAWSSLNDTDADAKFLEYAGNMGLNPSQFQSCLTSGKYQENITLDSNAASSQAQVEATPTFFINGVRVVGAVPFAELQKVIEEELKK